MGSETRQKDYLVIARKWRPLLFDDVIGQEHITTTLKNAITFSRVAHGYLFCGSRGVGKTSTARIFARALNCKSGPTITPCGVCDNCVEVTQGSSMDVIEIDGASNRGIDQIRELRDSVKFVPNSSRYKVYIIDEVHMLTKDAFNALLKTLEEPPSHAIFIFATTESHNVPATILSRCQVFNFHRINISHITAKLKEIADSEGIEAETGVLEAVARAGDGSMRDSQSMLDQVIAFCGKKIAFSQISQILGLYERELFFKITQYAYSQNTAGGIRLIDSILRDGKNVNHFMDSLLSHYRYLLLIKILEDKQDMFDCPSEELEKYSRQSIFYTSSELELAIELISETGIKLKHALSKQVLIELMFLKLSRIKSVISIDNALSKLEQLEAALKRANQNPNVLNLLSQPALDLPDNAAREHTTVIPPENNQPQPQIKPEPEDKPLFEKIIIEDISNDEPKHSVAGLGNLDKNQEPPLNFDSVNDYDNDDDNDLETGGVFDKPKTDNIVLPNIALSLETIENQWSSFCRSFDNPVISNFIDKVKLFSYDNGVLSVAADSQFSLSILTERIKDIEKSLCKFYKADISLKLKLNSSTADNSRTNGDTQNSMPINKYGYSNNNNNIEDEILNDPKTRILIDTFDAKNITVRRKP